MSPTCQRTGVVAVLGALCVATLGLLAGCGGETEASVPVFSPEPVSDITVYRFGVHPLHNPTRLHEIFSPVMGYLSRQIPGTQFRVEASRNYASYEQKLFAGEFHFALPNPYQTVKALEHGYHVFGKMGDDQNFRGIVLVRRDSGIERVADLRGKSISYPAPTALAATMMPQYFLHTHGLDVIHDVETQYVGSQESSIMNVYLGHSAAAATWLPPWRALSKERPELAETLEVKWQTDPLPNNGLLVRADVPAAVVDRVARLLFSLNEREEGRRMLGRMELSRFEPADDETYRPVRDFVQRFAHEIRDPQAGS